MELPAAFNRNLGRLIIALGVTVHRARPLRYLLAPRTDPEQLWHQIQQELNAGETRPCRRRDGPVAPASPGVR